VVVHASDAHVRNSNTRLQLRKSARLRLALPDFDRRFR
jgi:hypothetical protein